MSRPRGLALTLLAAAAIAAACSGAATPASPGVPTGTPEPRLEANVRATVTATPASKATPTPSWVLPRSDGVAGVLLLDYGPLDGWDPGRPGAARGALYPLEAGTGETLPGYEPFNLGQASTQLVSPDGRWLATSASPTQSSDSELRLLDIEAWREVAVEQLESPVRQSLGALSWSSGSDRLAGLRYRNGARPSDPWWFDIGSLAPSPLIEVQLGDLDQWDTAQFSHDGTELYALGYQSGECCGIDVQGDPFIAVFDLETGQETARIALPGVLIGQRFETVFDNDDEYNILRNPAMVRSADGASIYIVHADEDRVSTRRSRISECPL